MQLITSVVEASCTFFNIMKKVFEAILTKHAAFTFAPDNIRVNAVLPGGVRTPMVEESLKGVPGVEEFLASLNPLPPHLAEPVEIAELVYYTASNRTPFMTGSELVADGGMLTH